MSPYFRKILSNSRYIDASDMPDAITPLISSTMVLTRLEACCSVRAKAGNAVTEARATPPDRNARLVGWVMSESFLETFDIYGERVKIIPRRRFSKLKTPVLQIHQSQLRIAIRAFIKHRVDRITEPPALADLVQHLGRGPDVAYRGGHEIRQRIGEESHEIACGIPFGRGAEHGQFQIGAFRHTPCGKRRAKVGFVAREPEIRGNIRQSREPQRRIDGEAHGVARRIAGATLQNLVHDGLGERNCVREIRDRDLNLLRNGPGISGPIPTKDFLVNLTIELMHPAILSFVWVVDPIRRPARSRHRTTSDARNYHDRQQGPRCVH